MWGGSEGLLAKETQETERVGTSTGEKDEEGTREGMQGREKKEEEADL